MFVKIIIYGLLAHTW